MINVLYGIFKLSRRKTTFPSVISDKLFAAVKCILRLFLRKEGENFHGEHVWLQKIASQLQ